jgi:hypothetical protein
VLERDGHPRAVDVAVDDSSQGRRGFGDIDERLAGERGRVDCLARGQTVVARQHDDQRFIDHEPEHQIARAFLQPHERGIEWFAEHPPKDAA